MSRAFRAAPSQYLEPRQKQRDRAHRRCPSVYGRRRQPVYTCQARAQTQGCGQGPRATSKRTSHCVALGRKAPESADAIDGHLTGREHAFVIRVAGEVRPHANE
jgi:hypothetical protein